MLLHSDWLEKAHTSWPVVMMLRSDWLTMFQNEDARHQRWKFESIFFLSILDEVRLKKRIPMEPWD